MAAPVAKSDEAHICGGHWTSDTNGSDFDCAYGVEFECGDCVFVVGPNSDDKRRGKRPWAKRWQPKEVK